jgi:excisionase family DNA binding protein
MIFPEQNELTTQEAAAILRISRQSLFSMLDNNVLPYRKVGIRRRVHINDLNDYLKRQHVRRIEVV